MLRQVIRSSLLLSKFNLAIMVSSVPSINKILPRLTLWFLFQFISFLYLILHTFVPVITNSNANWELHPTELNDSRNVFLYPMSIFKSLFSFNLEDKLVVDLQNHRGMVLLV